MKEFEGWKRLRRFVAILSFLTLGVFLAGLLVLVLASGKLQDSLLLFGALVMLSLLVLIGGIALLIHRSKVFFETSLLRRVWSDYLEELVYSPKEGLPRERAEASGLVSAGDTYRSKGYLSGRHGSLLLAQADVTAEIPLPGKRSASSRFDGRLMAITLERRFASEFQIREKSFSPVQRLGDPAGNPVWPEDAEFGRFFRVMGDNPEKVRTLLTPSLREAVLSVNRSLPGDLFFRFSGNTLYVAIQRWEAALDFFALGKLRQEELRDAILSQVRVIAGFIEALYAEEALFLPESWHQQSENGNR